MKVFMCLLGIATMLTLAGCEIDEHEHHHGEGGAYDHGEHGNGFGDKDAPPVYHDRRY